MYRQKEKIRKRKTEKLRTIGFKVLIPVFAVLLGLLLCLFVGMGETRKLAEQYTEDTAGLYVEQINRDIFQINNELIQVLGKSSIKDIPDTLSASEQKYYNLLADIRVQNRLLKIRYKEVQSFFVYASKADVLIGDEGAVFAQSQVKGFLKELRDFSRNAVNQNYGVTSWDFLETEDGTYIVGWYAKSGNVIGCLMNTEKIFSLLQEMTQRYKVLPFLEKENGTRIYPADFVQRKQEMNQADRKRGNYYKYQLGTIGKNMCVCASRWRDFRNNSGNADDFSCAYYCFIWYLYFPCSAILLSSYDSFKGVYRRNF